MRVWVKQSQACCFSWGCSETSLCWWCIHFLGSIAHHGTCFHEMQCSPEDTPRDPLLCVHGFPTTSAVPPGKLQTSLRCGASMQGSAGGSAACYDLPLSFLLPLPPNREGDLPGSFRAPGPPACIPGQLLPVHGFSDHPSV